MDPAGEKTTYAHEYNIRGLYQKPKDEINHIDWFIHLANPCEKQNKIHNNFDADKFYENSEIKCIMKLSSRMVL